MIYNIFIYMIFFIDNNSFNIINSNIINSFIIIFVFFVVVGFKNVDGFVVVIYEMNFILMVMIIN